MTWQERVAEQLAKPAEQRDNRGVDVSCAKCARRLVTFAWWRDCGAESLCASCYFVRELPVADDAAAEAAQRKAGT